MARRSSANQKVVGLIPGSTSLHVEVFFGVMLNPSAPVTVCVHEAQCLYERVNAVRMCFFPHLNLNQLLQDCIMSLRFSLVTHCVSLTAVKLQGRANEDSAADIL